MVKSPPPCLVIGTPRSRTAWLSAFLSAPDRIFVHEPSVHWRDLDDLRKFLDQPGAAACDSGLTLFWRDAMEMRPDLRLIVVLRPLAEVFDSYERAGIPITPQGRRAIAETFDVANEAFLARNSFSVRMNVLGNVEVCRQLYRFAHGYSPTISWWRHWHELNVQRDWRGQYAAVQKNSDGFPRLVAMRARLEDEACLG